MVINRYGKDIVMSSLVDYKCPCCGAPIQFDSMSQNMKCQYCNNEFDAETLKGFDDILQQEAPDKMDWASQPGNEWMKEELDGKCVYLCNSCGGQIIAEENTGSTHCPYCGSPVVIMGQFSGDIKPDVVIPFKLDKEAAKAALKKHLEGKKLLPASFKTDSYIDDIQGVYVPFWLFDTEADASIRYRATRVRSWRSGNYRYTETSYYSVFRAGTLDFEAVPVDGSSRMADELMESIEPYDMSQAVDFATAYLSGYLADRYDITSEQSIDRANQRIKKSTEQVIARTVQGYTTVIPESSGVQFKNGKIRYALLPVWMLSTKWNDQIYTFAMNGQTGKFVGDLPMDKGAYWKWFGILAAVGGVAGFALSFLIKLFLS